MKSFLTKESVSKDDDGTYSCRAKGSGEDFSAMVVVVAGEHVSINTIKVRELNLRTQAPVFNFLQNEENYCTKMGLGPVFSNLVPEPS